MFLPTTREELKKLGWKRCDVILVSGDTYIDSPYMGVAVIGKLLLREGYRVGIIAQPAIDSAGDILRLGEPALYWGVTGGSVDSMVANFTALKKPRRSDDYTPGGKNTRRPNRAVIQYVNLIRRFAKEKIPVVLGGIEASLRRIAHYDYWSDGLRRSILFDAKADYLLYGMAEKSVVEFTEKLKKGESVKEVRGLAYLSNTPEEKYITLPSFEEILSDKEAFIEMYNLFYRNTDPVSARGLNQRHGSRWLIQNPPPPILSTAEMDAVYNLKYERETHPYYAKEGEVKALQTIRFSIKTHHGCYGECNFCAIAVHEGRTVYGRSEENILKEAREIARHPDFKGYISDVGGPTANMYQIECDKKLRSGICTHKRCVFPEVCKTLRTDHAPQTRLLKKIREIPGIKKAFVASGIRYDMLLEDGKEGEKYLREIVNHHVSGQMKIAPEHTEEEVLRHMGKPGAESLANFRKLFDKLNRQTGKRQFLTYYLIAAHPGCTDEHMKNLKKYADKNLKMTPEQVQVFTPTPLTYSSVMYYTEKDPFTGEKIFVEKDISAKARQKRIVTGGKRKFYKPDRKKR